MADKFITGLTNAIQQDNPKYNSYTSDLRKLVAHLNRVKTGNPAATAAEMTRIPDGKWAKYRRTRQYLFAHVPGLRAQFAQGSEAESSAEGEARGEEEEVAESSAAGAAAGAEEEEETPAAPAQLQNFHTAQLSGDGSGIKHVVAWESSSGNLRDLAHITTRERVSWMAPAPGMDLYLEQGYRQGGQHTGLATGATGDMGHGTDNHAILGPFQSSILRVPDNTTLLFSMDQTYEYTEDGSNWTTIPGSQCTIVRTVTRQGRNLRLQITKTDGSGRAATGTQNMTL